jgi:metal-responsive CopG/Arc/MetJ family transcriptional regulator
MKRQKVNLNSNEAGFISCGLNHFSRYLEGVLARLQIDGHPDQIARVRGHLDKIERLRLRILKETNRRIVTFPLREPGQSKNN